MFSATTKRFISYVGKVKLDHIADPTWKGSVKAFCEKMEKEDPSITKAEIKWVNTITHPHESNDDPNETEDVISVRFKNDKDKRVATAHVYKNGGGKVIRW